jgi:hypothetical protein
MADFEVHIDLGGRTRPIGLVTAFAARRPFFSNMTAHGLRTRTGSRWSLLSP